MSVPTDGSWGVDLDDRDIWVEDPLPNCLVCGSASLWAYPVPDRDPRNPTETLRFEMTCNDCRFRETIRLRFVSENPDEVDQAGDWWNRLAVRYAESIAEPDAAG